MANYKILIDTNIFIELEDSKEVDPAYAEFARKCGENNVRIFIHEGISKDIAHDTLIERRIISLSKILKFERLSGITQPDNSELKKQFGSITRPNDEVDVALLYALSIDAVDFVVTQDQGIHGRVRLTPLAKRVLTIEDALEWLRQTFEPKTVRLPRIEEKRAHEINAGDRIFMSLRESYPNFDNWWRKKCVREHRFCWTIKLDGEMAAIVVRKDETRIEAKIAHEGDKILKICTFKVKSKFRGEKLGELLLKQVIWFAQANAYDAIYLTTFPIHDFLIQIFEFFGFRHTMDIANGERVYEKPITRARLVAKFGDDLFTLNRTNYPRFVGRPPARLFCVPIKGEYHHRLFPELARLRPLPLFPDNTEFIMPPGESRIPGNTIRKVYLCRAKTRRIRPGDVLLFYHSKAIESVASQTVTSIGVVERINSTNEFESLVRLTAKRSVYSETELLDWVSTDKEPVKIIDFLHVGNVNPPVPLDRLNDLGIFSGQPPQSICLISSKKFEPVRKTLNLGFDL